MGKLQVCSVSIRETTSGVVRGGSEARRMDDTDRKLLWLISEDPRMPLKELAKRLGISRQAVDHRMQIMTKLGTFKSIKAEISFRCYSYLIFPLIWGVSTTESIDKTLDRLGESEFTTNVAVLGGGVVSIFGCVRSESELNDFVDFVKRAAEMPEPTVGLIDFDDGINPGWIDVLRPKPNRK
jgi:DNA-binding Lrp family transcriptional regulator